MPSRQSPSTQNGSPPGKDPMFVRGWLVVGAAFASMFFTGPGQTYSFALFINPVIEEFGWSRTVVSSLYSAATTVSGLLMFLVGRVVDRIGARRVNVVALAMVGVACLFASFIMSPVTLFFGFFLGRFFGQGTLGMSSRTVAPQWFERRRAMAIMVVGLGNSLAAMVYPLLNQWLIATFGWRNAFRFLGGFVWVIGLPIALIFLYSRPEDVGLRPDGVASREGNTSGPAEPLEVSLRQRDAIRTTALWFLTFAFFQMGMVGTGIAFHFVSIINDAGLSDTVAARVLSVAPLAGLTATLLMGLIMDRIRRPHVVLAVSCALQVVVKFMLAFLHREAFAYLFAIVSGSSSGVLALSVNVLTPHLFGRRYLGGILGLMSVFAVIGSAIGPLYFGVAFDGTGGYQGTLIVSSVFPAIAVVLALLIRKPSVVAKGDS